jgi:hypothetical protein
MSFFTKFANATKSIAAYLPVVLTGIFAVEQVIGASNGQTKKQIVLSAVDAAAKAGEGAPNVEVASISALIDTLVGVLNASGLFAKPAAAPAQKV